LKRGTPRHPKVASLADHLAIQIYAAVGLLELLWHFTAEYAPSGDIGRHTDQAIAQALHWRKKAPVLVNGLVESRWLDKHEVCRLVVHDWPDHADDATHMKLARARMWFFDGSVPSLKRLPSSERLAAEQFYSVNIPSSVRTDSAQDSHGVRVPARGGLGLGKGLGGAGDTDGNPLYSGFQVFIEIWQKPCECCDMRFPCSKVDLGSQQWMTLVDIGRITMETLEKVTAGLVRYRASREWHRDHGQWVPAVPKFLGWSSDGRPAEPLWNDHPAPFKQSGEGY